MPSSSQTNPFTRNLDCREPERNNLRWLCLFHWHFLVRVQQLQTFHAVNSLYTSCASSSHQLSKSEKINLSPPSPALVVGRAYKDRKTMLCLWASGAIAGLQKSEPGCPVWLQKSVKLGSLFPLSIWLTVVSLNCQTAGYWQSDTIRAVIIE